MFMVDPTWSKKLPKRTLAQVFLRGFSEISRSSLSWTFFSTSQNTQTHFKILQHNDAKRMIPPYLRHSKISEKVS